MMQDDTDLFDELDSPPEAEKKAGLDEQEARDQNHRAMEKVELDLDDAPFLDEGPEEEDQGPAEPAAEVSEHPGEDAPEAGTSLWRAAAGAGLALALTGVIVLLLLRHAGDQALQTSRGLPQGSPSGNTEQVDQPLSISFAPFLVEYVQEDSIRFLNLSITAAGPGTADSKQEVLDKTLLLRDAVYRYLKGKDLVFLGDEDNVETLKRDILQALNSPLEHSEFTHLYIVEYMVI
ncbi:MAG: flagellar basal body-associated FliL family protein [Desulfovibrionales bacterium]